MKKFEFYVDIYAITVEVLFSESEKEKKSYCDTNNLDYKENKFASCWFVDKEKKSLLIFSDEKLGNGVIAHEMLHVAFDILDVCNISFTYGEHEVLAYLLGYLVREFNKKYEELIGAMAKNVSQA